jgi:hypothetical protein
MALSLSKKMKFFFEFYKAVKSNKRKLYEEYYIKVDYVGRLYTILNFPDKKLDEAYKLLEVDEAKIVKAFNDEYVKDLFNFLDSLGLQELYRIAEYKQVDRYSYLIVVSFSLMDMPVIVKRLISVAGYTSLVGILVGLAYWYFW